jgi:hypothetical protein
MLNKLQIMLIQMAVKQAGIRLPKEDGRYRLLLAQYKQPSGRPVTSCKQLNNSQLEDLLAICEAHGWRMPGKPEDYFRKKVMLQGDYSSFAQQEAIKHLAGDLGWSIPQVNGLINKMTGGQVLCITNLLPKQAWAVIEALKAILGRQTKKTYNSLSQVKNDMEVTHAASQI